MQSSVVSLESPSINESQSDFEFLIIAQVQLQYETQYSKIKFRCVTNSSHTKAVLFILAYTAILYAADRKNNEYERTHLFSKLSTRGMPTHETRPHTHATRTVLCKRKTHTYVLRVC